MKEQTKGYILIFFGLFMLLGFVASSRDYPLVVDVLTFSLFVAAPVVFGVSRITKQSARQKREAEEQAKLLDSARQREVMRFLRERDGSATVATIATETSLPAAEAERALHELIIRGLVGMTTNSAGQVVYELVTPAGIKEGERRKEWDRLVE